MQEVYKGKVITAVMLSGWHTFQISCQGKPRKNIQFVERCETVCLQDSGAAGSDGSRFYALLVEVLKVEANVLLNDVLRPGADADAPAGTGGGQETRANTAVIAPGGPDQGTSAAGVGGTGNSTQAYVADAAGPSNGAANAPAGRSPRSTEMDVARPSQPAAGEGGGITAGQGVLLQPFQQPWTPEQQAERWAAAERAAAAAAESGVSTQQVLVAQSCSRSQHRRSTKFTADAIGFTHLHMCDGAFRMWLACIWAACMHTPYED